MKVRGNSLAFSPVITLGQVVVYAWSFADYSRSEVTLLELVPCGVRGDFELESRDSRRRERYFSYIAMKLILAQHLGIAVDRVSLERLVTGRWVCRQLQEQGGDFSVSHCGGQLVLSIAPGPIGIDIIARGKVVTHHRALLRFLADYELAYVKNLAGDKDAYEEALLRSWCGKEAYTKLLGRGLWARECNQVLAIGPWAYSGLEFFNWHDFIGCVAICPNR